MNAKRAVFYLVVVTLIAVLVVSLLSVGSHARMDSGRVFIVARMEIPAIATALNQFETTYGKFPTGDNSVIFQSLYGLNPQQIKFLNRGTTNNSGEMLDPWKLPYRIEIITQTNFVIRSAGKNRINGDKDDYVFISEKNDFVQKP